MIGAGECEIRQRTSHRMRALRQHDRVEARLKVFCCVGQVGRAVEEAAKQTVALFTHGADAFQHAIQRDTQQQQ